MKLLALARVRQVRLLPVVILAGAALLVLKGAGIMTGGGYVLTGPLTVQAAGGGHGDPASNVSMAAPSEPTITDDSPVLDDGAPTLPLRAGTAEQGHGPSAPASHGEPAATADAGHGVVQQVEAPCPSGLDFLAERAACAPAEASGETDAAPTVHDAAGNIVPLAAENGGSSGGQILERLADRRDELDQREVELEMRLALVEAAEKRISERTAALEALEVRINAMVDEKRTLEEAQFVAVVATYENMKAKDAAGIFDELEMGVLVRVARALNPRKLAPIMARMNPTKAKDLTASLAVDQVEPTIAMAPPGATAQLPQIIGQ